MSLFGQTDGRLQAVLEPSRLVRWVYVSRLVLASAMLIAALLSWFLTDQDKTLVVTLVFVLSLFVTAASFAWSDVRRQPLTPAFFYLQLIFDVLVVTAVVHVTDGQFAALYILVNAVAAIFLPVRGALLIAALGLVLYAADAVLIQTATAPLIPLVLRSSCSRSQGLGRATSRRNSRSPVWAARRSQRN